jgi:hypothetical protein
MPSRRRQHGVLERVYQTHPQRVLGWALIAAGEGFLLGTALGSRGAPWSARAALALAGVAVAVLLHRTYVRPKVEVWSAGVAVVQPFRSRFSTWGEIHVVRAVERLEVLRRDGRVLTADGVVALRALSSGELYADRVAAALNRRLHHDHPHPADHRLRLSPRQRRELQRSAWTGAVTTAAALAGVLALYALTR